MCLIGRKGAILSLKAVTNASVPFDRLYVQAQPSSCSQFQGHGRSIGGGSCSGRSVFDVSVTACEQTVKVGHQNVCSRSVARVGSTILAMVAK